MVRIRYLRYRRSSWNPDYEDEDAVAAAAVDMTH